MNKTENEIREGVLRAIRERSAEEIAGLFVKHAIKPVAGYFFYDNFGHFPPTCCCGLGVVTLDQEGGPLGPSKFLLLEMVLRQLVSTSSDARSFAHGFDGVRPQHHTKNDMYAKGRRVWELTNGKGVQA